MAVASFFVVRFIRNVDKEIEKLRSSVAKAAIDLSEKSNEIKMSLLKIEQSLKGTVDRVVNLIKKSEEQEQRLSTHHELHVKTAEILKSQKDQIKTVVTKVGNLTFVKEQRKKK